LISSNDAVAKLLELAIIKSMAANDALASSGVSLLLV
jgi:hypothetical protein